MPVNWLIVVPVWGEHHRRLFLNAGLPAIVAALKEIKGEHRFVIHTDNFPLISAALSGHQALLYRVPDGKSPHHQFGRAHLHALDIASMGEAVAFINADMVPSREVFAAAERRFSEGKRLIICSSLRTLIAPAKHLIDGASFSRTEPPIGETSRNLLKWVWTHRHHWITDCIFGEGKTRVPSLILFRNNDSVVLHGFHLHPFALLMKQRVKFRGTIDFDLIDQFSKPEIHVVTSPDELAFAEMSPPERDFGRRNQVLDRRYAVQWARVCATRSHRWLFGHQIVIAGVPIVDAEREADTILREIDERRNLFDWEAIIRRISWSLGRRLPAPMRARIRRLVGAPRQSSGIAS